MSKKIYFFLYLLLYFLIRVFSYFFQPTSITNILITTIILCTAIYFFIKNNALSYIIVTAELLLGGSGIFFNFFGLSLRTVFLPITLLFWSFRNKADIFKNKYFEYSVYLLIIAAALSSITGIFRGHDTSRVFADFIPYVFLLYVLPLREAINSDKFIPHAKTILNATVVGGFIFLLFSFFGFESGLFIMQDSYYHWYRDIAGGKITFVEFNFYRLVLNEHLALAGVLIYYFYKALIKGAKRYYFFLFCLLGILAINLTRIYFLAILAGVIMLINKKNLNKWVAVSAISTLTFFLFFCGIFLMASGGKSFGLEVFGLRLQSIIMPSIEDSSLSRILLLPVIIEMIKQNIFFGSGLGSTVSVYSPVFKQYVTTPHFDWGYLEIIAELGIFGTLAWLNFIYASFKKIKKTPGFALAIFSALLIINITSPALFHVFGVIIIITLLSLKEDRASEAPLTERLQNS